LSKHESEREQIEQRCIPAATPQSFNRYAYVNNDPVNFIDPSGLMPASKCDGITVVDPATGTPFCVPASVFKLTVRDTGGSIDSTTLAFLINSINFRGVSGGGGGGPQNPSGGGGRTTDGGANNPTDSLGVDDALVKLRCQHLRELLNREAKHGTQDAAIMSSTVRGGSSLYGLNNGPGAMTVNGKPIDQDWLVTLKAVVHTVRAERSSCSLYRWQNS
jgi:hypothetical protein